MSEAKTIEALQEENLKIAVQLKHLQNELLLTREEYEQASNRYFEIYTNLDRMVAERTLELKQVNSRMSEEIQYRQKTEEALLLAKESAEAAVQARGQFLANMSHEIRTPLNGIVGMLNLLSETELVEEQEKYVQIAESSADLLLSLINDILDFSKIESGRLRFEQAPFNLNQEIESLVGTFMRTAQDKRLELNFRYDPRLPSRVIGDRVRIRQILTNLIGNALKFTEQGQVFVEIERAGQEDRHILFQFKVTDTGIGIPKDKQNDIFQHFVQADSSTTRKFGGTGLGLAISRQLAELMGGEIRVESRENLGATFYVTLPLPPDPDDLTQDEAEVHMLANVRILIVDDNPITLRIFKEELSQWGARVSAVEYARQAFALLREQAELGDPFDLVVVDYQLPDLDGDELGRRIRADHLLSELPLILISSMGKKIDLEGMKSIGFFDYLSKPIQRAELYKAVLQATRPELCQKNKECRPSASFSADREEQTGYFSFGLRVLLVEDNAINQLAVKTMLEKFGCQVHVAENGKAAMETLSEKTFDLVFMDVQMPEMDGYETSARIRALPGPDARIPIVAMTANALTGDREKCLQAGMDDYLSKPVKRGSLLATLKKWDPSKRKTIESPKKTQSHAAPSEELSAVMNVQDVLNRYDQDVELIRELMDMFLSDAPLRIEAMRGAILQENPDELGRIAHTLAGASAQIGAERFRDVSREIERRARERIGEHSGELVDRLQEELAEVVHQLGSIRWERTGQV